MIYMPLDLDPFVTGMPRIKKKQKIFYRMGLLKFLKI